MGVALVLGCRLISITLIALFLLALYCWGVSSLSWTVSDRNYEYLINVGGTQKLARKDLTEVEPQ